MKRFALRPRSTGKLELRMPHFFVGRSWMRFVCALPSVLQCDGAVIPHDGARNAVHRLVTSVLSLTAVMYGHGHHKRRSRDATVRLLATRSERVLAAFAQFSTGEASAFVSGPVHTPKLHQVHSVVRCGLSTY